MVKLRSINAAKKSLGLVYLRKFRPSVTIHRKIIGAVLDLFLIYLYVSNAFLTRKVSAILYGDKFVFLAGWFFATSSRDATILSIRFLHVGARENVSY